MNDRVIPLTEPGPNWSQREYVECTRLGIGFAAHRAGDINQHFHYHFPAPADNCTTVVASPTKVLRYVDHGFWPGVEWIKQCVAAMRAQP
jgi:hypothetical protein